MEKPEKPRSYLSPTSSRMSHLSPLGLASVTHRHLSGDHLAALLRLSVALHLSASRRPCSSNVSVHQGPLKACHGTGGGPAPEFYSVSRAGAWECASLTGPRRCGCSRRSGVHALRTKLSRNTGLFVLSDERRTFSQMIT